MLMVCPLNGSGWPEALVPIAIRNVRARRDESRQSLRTYNPPQGACPFLPLRLWHRASRIGQCAPWPPGAGTPAGFGAGESTTVAGAEATASPVTMICPIMYGCGVHV